MLVNAFAFLEIATAYKARVLPINLHHHSGRGPLVFQLDVGFEGALVRKQHIAEYAIGPMVLEGVWDDIGDR